jgi:hypothetical protein
MDAFSAADLKTLIDQPRQLALSLYMPTFRAGAETQQNRTRLHNLLRTVEAQIAAHHVAEADQAMLLAPIRRLLDVPEPMQRGDGLALFTARDFQHVYHLPIAFAEQVTLDTRFQVTPLLPLLMTQDAWAVLALSQQHVRLLRGTRNQLREIPLPDVPHSLAEALRYDEFEKQHQLHAGVGTHGSQGARGAIFHGQGDHSDEEKDELVRFFRVLDRAVQQALGDAHIPLVLAGVAYEGAIYREVTTYPHVVDGGVWGNADDLRPDELCARAWPLVEPNFMQAQQGAIARYADLAGTDRTSTDLYELVAAARNGQIDTLLLADGQQAWGRVDDATAALRMSAKPQADDDDVLNIVAAQTIMHRGAVYALDPEHMPTAGPVAAILRY